MNTKISEIINEIKKNVLETEQEEAVHGSHFNIFSILQIEKKEVETHSFFIYDLLNPHGSHRKKDLFLKLFIENVLKLTDYGEIIRVNREDPTNANRRIDFVIETKKFIIGIEMKIDAGDQYNQLKDYYEELNKRTNKFQKIKLFYLTKFGDYAAYDSRKNLKAGTDYYTLSFRDHIDAWIDQCIQTVNNQQTLREGLVQYKNLLHKITNKGNRKVEDTLEEIVKDANDIKAMDIIVKNYPLLWAKKEIEFWDTIEKKFKKINNKMYSILYPSAFFDKNDSLCPNKLIDIRTKSGTVRESFGIHITKPIKNTNLEIWFTILYNQSIRKIIIDFDIYRQPRQTKQKHKLITTIKNNINVKIANQVGFYQLKETKLTYELFDSTFFDNITDGLVNEIVEYVNSIKKYEKEIQSTLVKDKSM